MTTNRSTYSFSDGLARPRGREITMLGGLAILGITCGALAKAADESQIHWARDLGDFPAIWVLAAASIGWLAPTIARAGIRAVFFFVAMCLAYYAWASFVLNFPVAGDIWVWTGAAVSAVPAIAIAVRWARDQRGLVPGLILASVAALAVVDGVIWQLWWAWRDSDTPELFPLRPFQALINVAVAVFIAGLLPRDHRTRLWALIILIPSTIVISAMIHPVLEFLFRFV